MPDAEERGGVSVAVDMASGVIILIARKGSGSEVQYHFLPEQSRELRARLEKAEQMLEPQSETGGAPR